MTVHWMLRVGVQGANTLSLYIYIIPDYADTCHVASKNNLEPYRKMGPEPLCMLWQGELIFQAQNVSARVEGLGVGFRVYEV